MSTQKFIVLVFLTVFSYAVFAQNSQQKYTFQRFNNERDVKLKTRTEITISFNTTIDSITKDTINKSVYGTLLSVNENSLQLAVNTEYKNVTYTKDSVCKNYAMYSYNYPVTYNSESINYMTYVAKTRPIIELSTFVSVITLVVLAPIFSYNVKEGTFNGDAYLMIAKPAAIATIVTLPLYFNIEERKIKFAKK